MWYSKQPPAHTRHMSNLELEIITQPSRANLLCDAGCIWGVHWPSTCPEANVPAAAGEAGHLPAADWSSSLAGICCQQAIHIPNGAAVLISREMTKSTWMNPGSCEPEASWTSEQWTSNTSLCQSQAICMHHMEMLRKCLCQMPTVVW